MFPYDRLVNLLILSGLFCVIFPSENAADDLLKDRNF